MGELFGFPGLYVGIIIAILHVSGKKPASLDEFIRLAMNDNDFEDSFLNIRSCTGHFLLANLFIICCSSLGLWNYLLLDLHCFFFRDLFLHFVLNCFHQL